MLWMEKVIEKIWLNFISKKIIINIKGKLGSTYFFIIYQLMFPNI